MRPHPAPSRILCLAAALAATFVSTTHAAPLRWINAAGGFFDDTANWNSGTVPGISDAPSFGVALAGSGPSYTVEFKSSPTNAGFFVLRDNVQFLLDSETYTITGSVTPMIVAQSSGESGVLSISKGTLITSAPAGLASTIGQAAGSVGLVSLASGGTWIDNAEERIGDAGTGTLNQPLGSHTVNNNLFIAFAPGSVGTYALSGTNASASITGNAYVGGNGTVSGGTGLLAISAGSLAITGALKIYNSGSLALSGGTLSLGSLDFTSAASRVNWTAGTLQIASTNGLNVGPSYSLGSSLALTPSKVLLANTAIGVGGAGILSISGGSLIGDTMRIAPGFGGTVNHSAGIVNLAFYLNIADVLGGTGVYNFSGGSITVSSVSSWGSGGQGFYNQTGGVASFSYIQVGSFSTGSASITLNDPTGVATLSIGYMNTGFGPGASPINIIRGTMSIATTLDLFNDVSPCTLSGGVFNINFLDTHGNLARFQWTSGTFNYTNGSGLLIGPSGPLGSSLTLNPAQTLTSTNTLSNTGIITLAGGKLGGAGPIVNNANISGFGSLTGSAGFTNNASLNPTGLLTLSNSGANANTGTIAFIPTAQLQLANSLSNSGFIDLNSASISGGSLTNSATGTINGPGIISSSLTNAGLITLSSGLLKTPSFTNSGVVLLSGPSAQIAAGATITNNGNIQGRGRISADLLNNAALEPTGGTLIVAGSLTNNATIRISTGNQLLITGAFPTNSTLISLTGGTLDTNNQPLANAGQISGFGVLATGGSGLTNNGAITFTGGATTINGPVNNNPSRTILLKDQPAIFTGLVTNNGTIKTTSTVATFAGGYGGTGAFLSDPSVNIFSGSVSIGPGGSMSGGPGDQFLFNSGAVSIAGSFLNPGLLQSSVNFANSGTFSQSGPQSWTPGTLFSNSGGGGNATFATNAGSPASPNLSITNSATLTLASPQNLAALSLTSGTATLTSGSTKTNALTIAGAPNNWSARLELSSNALILQATANKSSTLSTLANQITRGLSNNNGIASSYVSAHANLTTLALIDNSDLNLPSYAGQLLDANSLLITPALLGDSDLSGIVDAADFDRWYTHVGPSDFTSNHGDFDHSGITDAVDFDTWYLHVGLNGLPLSPPNPQSSSLTPSSPIPEPASLLLLLALPLLHRPTRRTLPRFHPLLITSPPQPLTPA